MKNKRFNTMEKLIDKNLLFVKGSIKLYEYYSKVSLIGNFKNGEF